MGVHILEGAEPFLFSTPSGPMKNAEKNEMGDISIRQIGRGCWLRERRTRPFAALYSHPFYPSQQPGLNSQWPMQFWSRFLETVSLWSPNVSYLKLYH